ncbi:M14 family metallopeptidase [uncultured Kriegella sp.]|uniref:M14 family metallopeptidase n=1 Tax=uncultured Kriegella sp. TaxID=1798910 RepID=UPI0030D9FC10|tara:strand:+ start:33762 stop:35510 length:1749 start_codon:yes stop_codon:yes gene_type:complete
MKIRIVVFTIFILSILSCERKTTHKVNSFPTHFERSDSTETTTYLQAIDFYIKLAKEFPAISIQTMGETDSGYPLHIVSYNPDGNFNFQKLKENKTIVFINNGIHPGESDGIDATMLLYRDFATGKIKPPTNTAIVTIPIYNVGGALNRNSTSRVNQNGPKSYGFRGNALNYDLNRDFIKTDTKNSRSFTEIFHMVDPDIFIDNHVSNGADYQYTLTHIFTQHNKLGGELGAYIHEEMMPALENLLRKDGWPVTPYVNVFNKVPEDGFAQFLDYPRYSSGYAALWNTFGMMVETHMLKPYGKRVAATYALLNKMIDIAEKDGAIIKALRNKAQTRHKNWVYYPTKWGIDTSKMTTLDFKGFEADTITSVVTGLNRLKYNRKKPFTKPVAYQNYYTPLDSVKIPKAYIIKKGWEEVISRLQLNHIKYSIIKQDTSLMVESYKILKYDTSRQPYEGHYLHDNTEVIGSLKKITFSKGDILVSTDQSGIRYLLETLEPETKDSFFNWNFFDAILQQKEGFSPYVFENLATEILEKNPILKDSFEQKKNLDPSFANDWFDQLNWIYIRSEYYEPAHLQYPVYRILK